jgi:hypothetical protein
LRILQFFTQHDIPPFPTASQDQSLFHERIGSPTDTDCQGA